MRTVGLVVPLPSLALVATAPRWPVDTARSLALLTTLASRASLPMAVCRDTTLPHISMRRPVSEHRICAALTAPAQHARRKFNKQAERVRGNAEPAMNKGSSTSNYCGSWLFLLYQSLLLFHCSFMFLLLPCCRRLSNGHGKSNKCINTSHFPKDSTVPPKDTWHFKRWFWSLISRSHPGLFLCVILVSSFYFCFGLPWGSGIPSGCTEYPWKVAFGRRSSPWVRNRHSVLCLKI